MRHSLARLLLFFVFALTVAIPANATPPPPPPPPRPFDDSALALRFEEWEEAMLRNVGDAAAKLSRARIAIRKAEAETASNDLTAKRAAREFAVAHRRSLEILRQLMILHADMKPVASTGDSQRLEETLNYWREWFTNTQPNSLEILEAMTR